VKRITLYRITLVCLLMRVLRFDRKVESPVMELLISSELGEL
jgi:hypothetical protein